jgi:hypothetical protein
MVCYVYDCNYVKFIPMRSRSASEWAKAYDTIHQELTVKGLKPKLQTLDNEASAAFKIFFTANDVDYQLVPPHCHRRNAIELSIRTSKEHLWQDSPQLTPPFHCTCGRDSYHRRKSHYPQLSAAAHFHGLVYYNKTAFAPTGCKIIAHEKPVKRRTWAPHGQHGYFLSPTMHHYRCQNVYISVTASERIVDTLEFFPDNNQMPQLSSTSRLLMAAKDMKDALHNPHLEVPFTRVGDDTILALTDLAAIFKLKLRQTPSPTPQAAPPKVTQRPCLDESSDPILDFPMPI